MASPDSPQGKTVQLTVRRRAIAVTIVILGVFAAVVAGVSLQLRGQWRGRLLEREGEVVRAVATMERVRVAEAATELELPGGDEPFEVALQTSKNWEGVLAVRLFDIAGAFIDAVPVEAFEGAMPAIDLALLARGEPVVRFHAAFRLSDLFLTDVSGERVPLLEVNAPLPAPAEHPGEEVIVQYWIDGEALARELAAVDRRVLRQALVAFGAGALLIAGSLFWGFRRLERANALLQARADDLARANRELAQSARTSAIGAITAHLMHGLRNPLSGLESFVASQGADAGDGIEWASARESARRLRALINEVHGVMGDVQTSADFEITSSELCAGLCERLQAGAAKKGVRIEVADPTRATLDAKTAGLGGLVLANLAQNAIEASSAGSTVRVEVSCQDGLADFAVSDSGPGLPDDVAKEPFRARRSTKPDGAGIGLAISWELARNAGGELSVARTGAGGSAFRLRLPATVSRPAGEAR